MRGIVLHAFGPFDNLVLEDVADPVLGTADILVDVRATSVNFADTLLVTGAYQFKPDLPFIPGKCPAGIVRAVGATAEGFRPGDRVLTLAPIGGFGERVVVKPSRCFRLPSKMSFIDAASMASVFDTAWIALRERAFVKSGETVLILGGSSGIGLAATQLTKAFGGRILSAIANPKKSELVAAAGADRVIDCSERNLKDGLRSQVLAATDGKGVDVVIDVLGGDVFDAAIRTVAWSGRMVIVGFAAGRIQSIKANYLLIKNISVSGMQISDYHRRCPETTARCWQEIFSLYEEGTIKPLPTVVWPLSRCVDALTALRARSVPGRIVLQQDRI
jgi:NADPH2:quinone reductase